MDNCPEVFNLDQQDFDADGDGFTYDVDCADLNPEINPGACDIKKDGIDQDCFDGDRTKGEPCVPDPGSEETCGDYTENKSCNADPNCEWNGKNKVCEDAGGGEPPSICSDYNGDETACIANNCRWNKNKQTCK